MNDKNKAFYNAFNECMATLLGNNTGRMNILIKNTYRTFLLNDCLFAGHEVGKFILTHKNKNTSLMLDIEIEPLSIDEYTKIVPLSIDEYTKIVNEVEDE